MFFSTSSARPIGYSYGEKNANPYLTPYIKIKSRWITYPSVKGETIKHLKENMEYIVPPLGAAKIS